MKITKAVVPVAGLGTRLLPTTKAIPKEMLPVGRYPIIQHVVEELAASGIARTLFVTSRNKLIEDSGTRTYQLFDLVDDPGEKRDLSDDDPERTLELRRAMKLFQSYGL